MRKILFLLFFLLVSCTSTQPKTESCFDVHSCSKYIVNQLAKHFPDDKSFKGQEVKIEFFLNDNAELIDYKIINASDLEEMNVAAINALVKSSPFDELIALPPEVFKEFKHQKLTIKPEFFGM